MGFRAILFDGSNLAIPCRLNPGNCPQKAPYKDFGHVRGFPCGTPTGTGRRGKEVEKASMG